MSDLKPCPFCGSKGITTHLSRERSSSEFSWEYQIVCDCNLGGCGGSGRYSQNPQEAIEAWNRRADK